MRIDFSAILLNLQDEPLLQPVTKEGEKPAPATLAWIASEALLRATDDKDGQKKYQLYALALKVGGGGEIEVKAEDIALLKQKIGEQFAPLVVGRAFDLLEQTKTAVSE